MMSSFSPYTDLSMSPNSPATTNSPRFQSLYVFDGSDVSMNAANCLRQIRTQLGRIIITPAQIIIGNGRRTFTQHQQWHTIDESQ
jgi:hypothetical protein